MKVNQLTPAQGDLNAEGAARTLGNLLHTDQSAQLPAGRSFASVLDSVIADGEDVPHPEASTDRVPDSSDPSHAADRSKTNESKATDDDDPIAGALSQPLGVASATEILDIEQVPQAREIMPASDVDNIVLTVRTELGGGVPQVIIDLPRSVLEGLRVKLSADHVGRISAEFLTRSESVRSQVAARSPELVEMLRSRGIDLSEMKTCVSGDMSRQSQSDHRENRSGPATVVERVESGENGSPTGDTDLTSRFTYRA